MKIDCKEAFKFNRDAFVGEIGTRKKELPACGPTNWVENNKFILKLQEFDCPDCRWNMIEPQEFDEGLKTLYEFEPRRLQYLMKNVLTHPMVYNG